MQRILQGNPSLITFVCRCLGQKKNTTDNTDGDQEDNPHESGAQDADQPEDGYADDGGGGWWDEEDPDAPWMTQSTKLMPNTTIAMWQFTP